MRRVVVTGLGAVTPLGVGVKHSWTNLINSRIGVRSLKEHDFLDRWKGLPSQVAGLVPRGKKADGGWNADEWLTLQDQRRMALFTQYAMAAAEEAITDAKLLFRTQDLREATGVTIGSGIGSLSDIYDTSVNYSKQGYRKVSPLFAPRLLINLAAGHIAMRWGLQGPNTAPTTACTTGSHAIGDAARLIAFGDADVMIAGASESCIHPLAIAGFARARSLSTAFNDTPQKASRPFDKKRDGFVIGEGAGVVVLEELTHALTRNAPIYAEVLGYGLSCDASHMTAPLHNGHGAYLAMMRALKHASCYTSAPLRVDYVNAHATGTALGDVAEVRAIRRALGQQKGEDGTEKLINVSSTKGAVGHLLGASGAVEAIFTVLALKHGILPPTMNLDDAGHVDGAPAPDSEYPTLDSLPDEGDIFQGINFVAYKAQHVPQEDMRVGLSNSMGFGGTNASLCFGRWDEGPHMEEWPPWEDND